MKTIKSKVKDKQPRRELFFCKKCGSFCYGTIYDIDTNKRYCGVHQTEEVFALSGERYPQELEQILRPTNYFYGATVDNDLATLLNSAEPSDCVADRKKTKVEDKYDARV